jgi:bifunctional DNA-binding transcriptional regulator/antitoxin component of YhaV-PrlF toxin-antitoxin module
MPRVSPKRQITLPVDQCQQAGIEPGDEYESYVAEGCITIVRKSPGAARGMLTHVQGNPSMSDDDSLQDALSARQAR